MKRLLLTTAVLALATVMASDALAAWPRIFRRNRSESYRPAPTAPATTGYRAYSYQPAPAVNYGTYRGGTTRYGGHAFENVTNKALGRVN